MAEPASSARRMPLGETIAPQPGSGGVDSGGDGPHDPTMEARIAALESSVSEIKAVLHRLEPMITRMDERLKTVPSAESFGELKERLKTLPSAESFGELKGRVASLPTWWTLLAFAVIAAGLPALIAKINF
jgi:uncharacterized coiled-coil protein SlyX